MIKINEKLTVLHDDNSSFSDLSDSLVSFDRDSASFTFVALEDSVYIGFYKPINVCYVEFTTANTNSVTTALKYYNGSAFAAVSGLHDDTKGFTRNGFVRWTRGQTDEAKTTINSSEMYWYKLDLSGDSTAMVIAGLNIVFSDDQDLKREFFEITKYVPSGEATHILSHAASRDHIIQNLNILGKSKAREADGWTEHITAFDLLDISEVKLASTYLTLAKILFNVSDDADDVYAAKSQAYKEMAANIINNTRLKVDADDDGVYDQAENTTIISGTITRL